jgi:hypothetical protein
MALTTLATPTPKDDAHDDVLEEGLLTPEELRRITGLKPSTERELRRRGRLPFIRLGGPTSQIIRYRRSAILAWIAAGLVDARRPEGDAE